MPKSTQDLLEQLYAKMNNVILPADLSPNAPPPAGFVTVMLPGTTVTTDDFDTSTTEGKRKVYQFMDRIPAVNKRFVDSARTVSGMYPQVLSAQVPEGDPEKAAAMRQKFDEASEFLESDVYDKYLDYRDEYFDARDDYLYEQNMEPKDQRAITKAKRTMETAFEKWQTRGKKQLVEDYINTVRLYLSYTPKAVFASAGSLFETSKDDDTGHYPVDLYPSNWATNPEELSWAKIIIKEGSSADKIHNETSAVHSDFNASFNYGLWHGSASGGYDKKAEQLNKKSTVEKLGMSFEIARVDIVRSWFNAALLTYPNASVISMKKGKLCSGTLRGMNDCTFPFIPTSFVVARNIALYNEFTEDEYNFVNESSGWSANVEVGYGPFSVGNNTSVTKTLTDEEKKEFGSSIKIDVGSEMQIIGFTNSILTPAFPSADDQLHQTRQMLRILSETMQ